MLQRAASNAYSWWWASHIRTKQSNWLEQNLQDFEDKVQSTLKLIEEEGDSFAKRAEMYYKNRPELIIFVQESFRSYRALAERYDHLSTELQKANTTIATVFPEKIQLAMEEEDEFNSLGSTKKLPQIGKFNAPKAPAGPVKELKSMFSNANKKFQPKTKAISSSSAPKVKKSGLSRPEALGKIDKLQKEILVLQTEKEFLKSSYEQGVKRFKGIDVQIVEMQQEVFKLQDEFGDGMFIEDEEARNLMASSALQSCQEAMAKLQKRKEKMIKEAEKERERMRATREKVVSLIEDAEKKNPSGESRAELIRSEEPMNIEAEAEEQKKEIENLKQKIKEQFKEGDDSCLTVSDMAEKIDELVEKVISFETELASQTALVQRLRNETDELQGQVQVLENDNVDLVSDPSKLKEMEAKLRVVQEIDRSFVNQNNNLQTNFTEARCNIDHMSEKLGSVKPDGEVEGGEAPPVKEKKPKRSKKEKAERKARKLARKAEKMRLAQEAEMADSSQTDKEQVGSQEESEARRAHAAAVAESVSASKQYKEPEITDSSQTVKEYVKEESGGGGEAVVSIDDKKLDFKQDEGTEITGSPQPEKEAEKPQEEPEEQEAVAIESSSGNIEKAENSEPDEKPNIISPMEKQEGPSKELKITGSMEEHEGPHEELTTTGSMEKEEVTNEEDKITDSMEKQEDTHDEEVEITGSMEQQEGTHKEIKITGLMETQEGTHEEVKITGLMKIQEGTHEEVKIIGSIEKQESTQEDVQFTGSMEKEEGTQDEVMITGSVEKEEGTQEEVMITGLIENDEGTHEEVKIIGSIEKQEGAEEEVKITGSMEKQDGAHEEVKITGSIEKQEGSLEEVKIIGSIEKQEGTREEVKIIGSMEKQESPHEEDKITSSIEKQEDPQEKLEITGSMEKLEGPPDEMELTEAKDVNEEANIGEDGSEASSDSIPKNTVDNLPTEKALDSPTEKALNSLPEKAPDSSAEKAIDIISEKVPDSSTEKALDSLPEKDPDSSTEMTQNSLPENAPGRSTEMALNSLPEKAPDSSAEKTLNSLPEKAPDSSAEKALSNSLPEETPESIPKKTPDGPAEKTLNSHPKKAPENLAVKTEDQKLEESSQEEEEENFLDFDATEQENEPDDEPNWRVLYMKGTTDREQTLLAEYTAVLRNFKEVKTRLMEVERRQQDGLFESAMHLKELKNANAMKDEEIRTLRQKLKQLQAMLDKTKGKSDADQSPAEDDPKAEVEDDDDEYDLKFLMRSQGQGQTQEISEVEEKFRGDIDALLEENLDFWLRFSASFHQIQKFETEIQDLKNDVAKIHKAKKSEGSNSRKTPLKTEARSVYKHLSEIQTELTVWLEQSLSLKEELQCRFSSLCSLQEELTKALKESAEDEDFKFTTFQAAKFQGELLNMKQENNKVKEELQAGYDHVSGIQRQVEKCLKKLNDEFGFVVNTKNNSRHLQHSESRNRVPLRSFIFGAAKKQKQSLFSTVSPALNKKYNIIKQGVQM